MPEKVDKPTVILGVPERPNDVVAKLAVDAVPVTFPTKLVAVTIPAFKFVVDVILVVKPARLEVLEGILLLLFSYLSVSSGLLSVFAVL
jgi:hypothetical protein